MDEITGIIVGIVVLGLILTSLGVYIVWEIKVNKRKIKRNAEEDSKLINSSDMEESIKTAGKLQELAGDLIGAISALAGITIAAVFIIIGLHITDEIKFLGNTPTNPTFLYKDVIMYIVLGLSGTASMCWLIILEQLAQMKSPSMISSTKRIQQLYKFHRYNYTLWIMGLFLIFVALYLFLLLANFYVSIATGVVTALMIVRYWRINNEWDTKTKKRTKAVK
jgi:hypothetical protein